MSKEDCEEAAMQLGLPDTEASEETVSNWPPYCYFHIGNQLWFNNDARFSYQKQLNDMSFLYFHIVYEYQF